MYFSKSIVLATLAAATEAAITAQQMTANIDAITDLSAKTDNIARSISIVNFFSTGPRLVNNFRQIITIVGNNIAAMSSTTATTSTSTSTSTTTKRSLQARQECLDVEDIEGCISNILDVLQDPSQLLGSKKRSVQVRASALQARQSTEPTYTEVEQQAVCDSFRGFVQVHQQLLATVIGKHGLLSLTPFTQPIAFVLRLLEGGVDTIAFAIIDSVPTCAQGATQNKMTLQMTLTEAINKYSK